MPIFDELLTAIQQVDFPIVIVIIWFVMRILDRSDWSVQIRHRFNQNTLLTAIKQVSFPIVIVIIWFVMKILDRSD
jgi:hypothetical protein